MTRFAACAAVRAAVACSLVFAALGALAASVAPGVRVALSSGQPVDVVVLLRHADVDGEARARREARRLPFEDDAILAVRAQRYRARKDALAPLLSGADVELLRDYSQLPMLALRLRSAAALERLAAHPDVLEIHEDRRYFPQLAQSLPLIGQPAVAAAGLQGSGTTVAVIDTAVDYANAVFGCTAPGTPAGCKVAATVSFATNKPPADDLSHGTNVAAIVVGVAPGARVASLNVFDNGATSASWIISAINWAISNRSAYNIVAINMSLGDNSNNASPCTSDPLDTPIQNALAAGLLSVAASGNNSYTNGISSPACIPDVISVGAVYDSNIGSVSWSSGCTDATTAADQITCFTNSGSLLTMLAPGAWITAAGIIEAGTSQASPHVAGAVAVDRAAFPGDSLSATRSRVISSNVQLTDPRNGLVRPRLALPYTVRPANDDLAFAAALSGASGSVSGTSLFATTETGEPAHAGAPAGHSVWWTWTAPADGQASFQTSGSGFDTVLGAYTGPGVAALAPVAENDNGTGPGTASRIYFQAASGQTYRIAVDGASGASGAVALAWSLDTAAQADLSVTLSESPNPAPTGTTVSYTLTISNAGPKPATNVSATLTLPSGAGIVALPSGCSASSLIATCGVSLIEAGAQASFTLSVVLSASGNATASVSVAADTPDPVAANGSSEVITLVQFESADVPVMPLPAFAAMAALLLGLAARRAA
jgi:uncharacterized repeat protein (TIGR01451 family)